MHSLLNQQNNTLFLSSVAEWLMQSGNAQHYAFYELEPEEFAILLRKFYYCVRAKNGELYSKSALKNIRAGLHRFLTSPPHNKLFNIMHDPIFKKCNDVFDGYVTKLREEGQVLNNPKPTVEPEDVAKLYTNVFDNTPKGLQYRVFWELCLHFGRRGREGLRDLHKKSFEVQTDAKGQKFVQNAYHEHEKCKTGKGKNVTEKEPKMYAVPGSKDCPVMHYERYIKSLHPQCDALFQRAKKRFTREGLGYDNAPLGIHTLSDMMVKMTELGKLSQHYTNHCIRKTCVTALADSGFEAKDIMTVTGHKNVQSLDPYLGKASDKRKKSMSDALSRYGKAVEVEAPCGNTSTTATVSSGCDNNAQTSAAANVHAQNESSGNNDAFEFAVPAPVRSVRQTMRANAKSRPMGQPEMSTSTMANSMYVGDLQLSDDDLSDFQSAPPVRMLGRRRRSATATATVARPPPDLDSIMIPEYPPVNLPPSLEDFQPTRATSVSGEGLPRATSVFGEGLQRAQSTSAIPLHHGIGDDVDDIESLPSMVPPVKRRRSTTAPASLAPINRPSSSSDQAPLLPAPIPVFRAKAQVATPCASNRTTATASTSNNTTVNKLVSVTTTTPNTIAPMITAADATPDEIESFEATQAFIAHDISWDELDKETVDAPLPPNIPKAPSSKPTNKSAQKQANKCTRNDSQPAHQLLQSQLNDVESGNGVDEDMLQHSGANSMQFMQQSTGSLFAGAVLNNCVFHIHLHQ